MSDYFISVFNNNKRPFSSCTPKMAHSLVRAGKASVFDRYPLTIILKPRPSELKGEQIMTNSRFKVRKNRIIRIFKMLSIMWGGIGGILLALNTEISPYGFVFTALSSFSWIIASSLEKDRLNLFYGATLFFGVDLLGVFRWIIV